MKQKLLQAMVVLLACLGAHAQVNSGSNGSDGAFNPTTNIVINMADHPNGIYQYTSVNISNGVTVTFIPNANNTPIVWLVQSNVVVNGTLDVSGQTTTNTAGGVGGPGGWAGGVGGSNPTVGQGPGGGSVSIYTTNNPPTGGGGSGSFGTKGSSSYFSGAASGEIYGNSFLIPLIGGSGGAGSIGFGYNYSYFYSGGGGGGGGAILIAASGSITANGSIAASGGSPYSAGGGGSGGAIRLIATTLAGTGSITAQGAGNGNGRIRFDALQNNFAGYVQNNAAFAQGYQPIIIQTNGQGGQLTITSIGGVPVSASPGGQLATPDAVLSAQQNNPIPVVVHCSNIPLNTQITVSVKPAIGAAVSATGLNSSGTLSSSTAAISINIPRGGGIIYATAAN